MGNNVGDNERKTIMSNINKMVSQKNKLDKGSIILSHNGVYGSIFLE